MSSHFFKTIKNSINYWYIPLIVGIVFIATGAYTLSSPLESYVALSLIFSISFLVSGVSEIIFSLSNKEEIENWGWYLFFGLGTTIIGSILLAYPEITMVTLPLFISFLVLFRSIGAVSFSLDLMNYGVLDWGYLLLIGVLGILFSLVLLWNPIFAGMTLVSWTGLAFIVAGIFNIYLSIKLKRLNEMPEMSKELKDKYEEIKKEMREELLFS